MVENSGFNSPCLRLNFRPFWLCVPSFRPVYLIIYLLSRRRACGRCGEDMRLGLSCRRLDISPLRLGLCDRCGELVRIVVHSALRTVRRACSARRTFGFAAGAAKIFAPSHRGFQPCAAKGLFRYVILPYNHCFINSRLLNLVKMMGH